MNNYNQEFFEDLEKKREEEQRRINRRRLIITIAVLIIIAICCVNTAITNTSNGQLRNMATEPMNSDYTNVYIDAVLVEPVYFVYEQKTTKTGVPFGMEELREIVCKCITVEGETVWASFFYQRYPGGNFSKFESDYRVLTYSNTNPLRINGRVNNARQVTKELESEIGDVFVLDVDSTSTEQR